MLYVILSGWLLGFPKTKVNVFDRELVVARAALARSLVVVAGRNICAVAPEVTCGGGCSAVRRLTIRAETEALLFGIEALASQQREVLKSVKRYFRYGY